MDDLISREAAVRALASSNGDYLDALERLEKIPAVGAVPVEWMREKMRGYASSLKSTEMDAVVRVMQMWQKEQEGV